MVKLQITKIKEWLILSGLFLIVSLVLWWQAFLPAWRDHLQTDVVTFYNRSHDFWLNGSLAAIKYNEYQPGALLFFLLPGLEKTAQIDFYVYEKIFISLNIFLLFCYFWFYWRQRPFLNVLFFIMIIAFGGPILLFRFELLVSLITLLSFYFWGRKRQNLALILLGLATSIKIYPLLFLPYFIILVLRGKELKLKMKLKSLATQSVFFITGFIIPIIITYTLDLTGEQIVKALMFHSLKPVGIEGFPAMIVTILQKITTDIYPTYIGAYGVNGLPWDKVYLGQSFYNYFWTLPVFFFYYLIWCCKKEPAFDYRVPFLLILLFLITSKGLNPQYIFWFLFFFPMIKIGKNLEKPLTYLFIILISGFLTQLIYPLTYTQFLLDFYSHGTAEELFFLNSARNLFLLGLFIGLLKDTFFSRQNETL